MNDTATGALTDRQPLRSLLGADMAVLLGMGLLKLLLHLPLLSRYGYFRDELYYIACSDHLAWGYVDQPPLSLALLAVTRTLFGDSLAAIRFLPALVGALTVVLTGVMARQLGGGRFAQFLASLAALTLPVILGNAGRYFSMNAFDLLFWALAASLALEIVRTGRGRLWLWFGLVVGLGLLNKYSMGFFVFGLLIGVVVTPHRRHLREKWFWLGGLIAALVVLPHLIWEVQHGIPTAEFIRNASTLKNTPTSPLAFFLGQLLMTGPGGAIIWIAGLAFFLVHSSAKQYRLFGWMYLAIFFLMAFQNSKAYYLSPIYPLLLAGGSCLYELLARRMSLHWLRPATASLLLLSGMIAAPLAIPVLPVNALIDYQKFLGIQVPSEERGAQALLPQYYADMFGWPEMAATIADAFRKLTPGEQSRCIIYVRNYGEAAAVDFFGKQYGLPRAACAHNSYWYWKPESWSGEVGIFMGARRDSAAAVNDLKQFFDSVEPAGATYAPLAMPYENGRLIFICRGAHITLDDLWRRDRLFI